MAKRKTFDQIQAMQAKAVRFLRDVVGDPDKADEFEALSPEEYAEHKGVEIVEGNPTAATITITRRPIMATKRDLEERIAELEDENEELNDRLDQISDLTSSEEDEEDDDGVEDEDADGLD